MSIVSCLCQAKASQRFRRPTKRWTQRVVLLLALQPLSVTVLEAAIAAYGMTRQQQEPVVPVQCNPVDSGSTELHRRMEQFVRLATNRADGSWAGQYVRGGEVIGEFLFWAPEAGYLRLPLGPLVPGGDFSDCNGISGSVLETESRVILAPDPKGGSPRSVTSFLKVQWGERHYLIEEGKRRLFCDYVSGVLDISDAQNYREFFVRAEDEDRKSVSRCARFLEPRGESCCGPVEARVLSVGKREIDTQSHPELIVERLWVTLDVGKQDRVQKGTTFSLSGLEKNAADSAGRIHTEITVSRIRESSSSGWLKRSVPRGGRDWREQLRAIGPAAVPGTRVTSWKWSELE